MKLLQVIDDILSTMRGIAKMEIDKAKVIPALKKGYKDLRKEYFDLERINKNQTQYARKLNSIKRRFDNANKEPGYTWEQFCSECEAELLAEYALPIYEKVAAGVAQPISVTSPLLDKKIKEQKELWEKHQATIPEITKLRQRLDREKLELKDYHKNWTPQRITKYLQSPTDSIFDRCKSSVLQLIDDDAFKKWEAQQNKRAETQKREQSRIQRERDAEKKRCQARKQRATRIFQGKEKPPECIKNYLTNNRLMDMPFNLLTLLLKRQEQKEQREVSSHA